MFQIARKDKILFVQTAENLRNSVKSFIERKKNLLGNFEIEDLSFSYQISENPLKIYRRLLKKSAPEFNFVLSDEIQPPFIILTTSEKFPRVLATRRPELAKKRNDSVYGAFLPTGFTRRLLDVINRVFRLRTCELDIKGDFEIPCPEFFFKRCLAPCVQKICGQAEYAEAVEMVHLLLFGQNEILLNGIRRKIEEFSEILEFEKAAEWRDNLEIFEEIFAGNKWKLDVSQMNDVITAKFENGTAKILVTTLRRGKSVGERRFQAEISANAIDESDVLPQFIAQYYRYYLPKQIFVSKDFAERKFLENCLSENFYRKLKIVAKNSEELPVSIQKTQKLASSFYAHKPDKTFAEQTEILRELKKIFFLRKMPKRIECFDVAHLAGSEIIAARVAAIEGKIEANEEMVWDFENLSETAALAEAVRDRLILLADEENFPDLIAVDGGKPQISQVQKVLDELNLKKIPLVGIVKPPNAHNQVSHFLKGAKKINFDKRSAAMNFLQNLRDKAHELSNTTHRKMHSLVQIFETKTKDSSVPHVQHLLVPMRFTERNGNAEDLQPIRALDQSGKLLLS